jgi:phage-related protein (TIGR01555 family)
MTNIIMKKNKKLRQKSRIKDTAGADRVSSLYQRRMTGGYGGFSNSVTGAGYENDKSIYSSFTPSISYINKVFLETMYNESWVAKRIIDLRIDDMFLRWRSFSGMSDEATEKIQDIEDKINLTTQLNSVMKAGNLYGSAILLIVTVDAPYIEPLQIDNIAEGDKLNLLVFDRFDITVNEFEFDTDMLSVNYNKPLYYNILIRNNRRIKVHHSRIIRFDGITSLTLNGFKSGYERYWGIPTLIPIIKEVFIDSSNNSVISQLIHEASIGVNKMENFDEAIEGKDDEMTIEERCQLQTMLRSVYRSMYIGAKDSFERVSVPFTGIPDLLDKNARRLAAASGIPETRFWGRSPAGENATGESDMINYAIELGSLQIKAFNDSLKKLDAIMSRIAGITEKIDYKFPPLLDISDKDKADTLSVTMGALTQGVGANLLTEEEARRVLDGNDLIGNLDLESTEIPELTELKNKILNNNGEEGR